MLKLIALNLTSSWGSSYHTPTFHFVLENGVHEKGFNIFQFRMKNEYLHIMLASVISTISGLELSSTNSYPTFPLTNNKGEAK